MKILLVVLYQNESTQNKYEHSLNICQYKLETIRDKLFKLYRNLMTSYVRTKITKLQKPSVIMYHFLNTIAEGIQMNVFLPE